MSKAQAGLELVLVVSFVMLASVALLWLLQSTSQQGADTANVLQAQQAVQAIAAASNEVYYQGGNARKTVNVFIPQNARKITIGKASGWGNEVVIEMQTSYGITEAVSVTIPQVRAPLVIVAGQPDARQAWLDKPGSGIIPLNLTLAQVVPGEYGVEIKVVG